MQKNLVLGIGVSFLIIVLLSRVSYAPASTVQNQSITFPGVDDTLGKSIKRSSERQFQLDRDNKNKQQEVLRDQLKYQHEQKLQSNAIKNNNDLQRQIDRLNVDLNIAHKRIQILEQNIDESYRRIAALEQKVQKISSR